MAYRISRDEDDEDAPYQRPGAPGKAGGRGGDREGADARRADEPAAPTGLSTMSLDGGEEPSIGRGQVCMT